MEGRLGMGWYSTHRGWAIVSLVIAAAATVVYVAYDWSSPAGASGSSWPGMLFGIAGSAFMLFAGLLSARKKLPALRVGRASSWLRAHIWLGLLSFLFILYHSAFRWGGLLEKTLWAVFVTILVSGIAGVLLQRIITRWMTSQVPYETVYEQIPSVCEQLRVQADGIVTDICGDLGIDEQEQGAQPKKKKKQEAAEGNEPIKEFYLRDLRGFLGPNFAKSHFLADSSRSANAFGQLKMMVPEPLHGVASDLERLCDERRQLALQARLHHYMHGWLFLHVPLSCALVVLALLHILTAMKY